MAFSTLFFSIWVILVTFGVPQSGLAAVHCVEVLNAVPPLRFSEIHHEFLGQKLKTRPLVLIHGINSNMETFRDVGIELAKSRPVLIYDCVLMG
jgi:pimeloyl-ACP methyl ester carboxylesterase